MHTTASLTFLSLILAVLLSGLTAAAIVWAAWHYLRAASFKAAGEISDRQETEIRVMRRQIKDLQRMTQMQDKRLNRSEIESQRKDRLLFNARQEIEYFEDILRILLPVVTRMAPDEKRRVDAVLKQLGTFRGRAAREQVEWEETKDAMSIFLTGLPDDDDDDDDDKEPK